MPFLLNTDVLSSINFSMTAFSGYVPEFLFMRNIIFCGINVRAESVQAIDESDSTVSYSNLYTNEQSVANYLRVKHAIEYCEGAVLTFLFKIQSSKISLIAF